MESIQNFISNNLYLVVGIIIMIAVLIYIYYFKKIKENLPDSMYPPRINPNSPTNKYFDATVTPTNNPLGNSFDNVEFPGLINKKVDAVIDGLKERYPNYQIDKVPKGSAVTCDYRTDRIRVWYDPNTSLVSEEPTIG